MTPELMLDMETLSLSPRPVVLSIAVVPFFLDGNGIAMDYDFYHSKLRLDGQQAHGLEIDAGTVGWWLTQSDKARNAVMAQPRERVDTALLNLANYFKRYEAGGVWAYGAAADPVWLRSLYEAYGYDNPVHYRRVRCLRTIAAFSDVGVPADYAGPNDIEHDAFWDCARQIKLAQCAHAHYIGHEGHVQGGSYAA